MAEDSKPAFVCYAPPSLKGLASANYGYRSGQEPISSVIEPARIVVALIFNFGAPFRIALSRRPRIDETWTSFVGGLHPGTVCIESGAGAECVQVNLTPLGARQLLSAPAHEFSSRLTPLDALGDRELDEHSRRLAEMSSWDQRLRATEAFLVRRFAAKEQQDEEAAWAAQQILAHRGSLRVGALCEALGWSRRRLAERFTREIGLAPKSFARISRFEHAVKLASDFNRADWADVAASAGYADQSHMTREFVEFAGCAPERWRAKA